MPPMVATSGMRADNLLTTLNYLSKYFKRRLRRSKDLMRGRKLFEGMKFALFLRRVLKLLGG